MVKVESTGACNCGQEEKVVVLVGCTQHGKSSLIRSILDYGGNQTGADEVKTGAFGSKSTTKEAKSFHVVIKIRDHMLKDTDGEQRQIDFSEEPDDLYDLLPESHDSGEHIHLRLIDTPGLDDSDNSAEQDKINQEHEGSSASFMRVVDEKHKFTVFKALAEAGKMHAVCFVLDLWNNLCNTAQEMLLEYIRIFEMSELGSSYHFAHTKVDVDKMFERKARERPGVVDQTFGIGGGKTKHHLINNIPKDDDAIAQHFAQWSMARLLRCLLLDNAQEVADLRYPKSTVHDLWDRELRQAFEVQRLSWQDEISTGQRKISDSEGEKGPLKRREERQWTDYCSIRDQADALDTEDYVEVGAMTRYERGHFMSTNRLSFYVTAKSTIRKYEATHCSDSYWSSFDDETCIGKTECSGYLVGNEWNVSTQGTIKLWGWKKEVRAKDLEQLRREQAEARSNWCATYKRIEEIESEIKGAIDTVTSKKDDISGLVKEVSSTKCDHIPISAIKEYGQHFGSPSIIAYAYGQQINRKIGRWILPGASPPYYKFKEVFNQKARSSRRQEATCKSLLKTLEEDTTQKRKLLSDLEAQRSSVLKELRICEKELSASTKSWAPRVPEKCPHEDAGIWTFEKVCATLQARVDAGHDLISDIMQEKSLALRGRLLLLNMAIQELDPLLKENEAMKEKWSQELLGKEAETAAAQAVESSTNLWTLPIAVFAVLRQGIEDSTYDSQVPWDRLFFQFKHSYLCDPANWSHFLKELGI